MPLLNKYIYTLFLIVIYFAKVDFAFSEVLPTFSQKIEGPKLPKPPGTATGDGEIIDFDGDGLPEIVQTYGNYPPSGPNRAEKIKILKASSSTLTYTDVTNLFTTGIVPSFVHPRVFAKGDFNKDKRPDLFIGGHGWDAPPFPMEKNKLLLSTTGGKLNGQIAQPDKNMFTHAAASGDINLDGIDDIYVGTICCSQGPFILLGRSNAAPILRKDLLAPAVTNLVNSYTSALLVDVDNSKGVDLILGGNSPSESVLYLNNGLGSFNKNKPDYTLPAGYFGKTNTVTIYLASMDFDTDGNNDLLLSQTAYNPFYQGYSLQLLINNGSGKFFDQSSTRLKLGSGYSKTGNWKPRIIPADFFGDGLVDLVVDGGWPTSDSSYVIWLNDGSGYFTPYTRSLFDRETTGDDTNIIYPIDLNKDGRSDIIKLKAYYEYDQPITYINTGFSGNSTNPKIQIVRQPVGGNIRYGSTINLSVSARGMRPLKFQWFKDGKTLIGSNRPVLKIMNAKPINAGNYSVMVSNSNSSIKSLNTLVKIQQ